MSDDVLDLRGRGRELRDRILTTIDTLREQLGRGPTPAEMATTLGIARSTLQYHVIILEEAGLARRVMNGRHREAPAIPPSPMATLEAFIVQCVAELHEQHKPVTTASIAECVNERRKTVVTRRLTVLVRAGRLVRRDGEYHLPA
jgi:predicted transcriptional regulator